VPDIIARAEWATDWELVNGGPRTVGFITGIKRLLMPVLLGARGTQPGGAALVDRGLPGEEFVDREHVAVAGFVKREQTTAHGCDQFGLAPDNPASRSRCRQIRDGQRAAVRADHVLGPRLKGFHHEYSRVLHNSS
jgi:hypothetical protein